MPPRKKTAKKIKSTNGCFIITVLLTVLMAISLAATFYFLFLRPTAAVAPTTAKSTTAPTAGAPRSSAPIASPAKNSSPASSEAPPAPLATPAPISLAESPLAESKPAAPTTPEPSVDSPPEPPQPSAQTGPRIAIIIDDIGDTKKIAEQIIAIDLPLAFSILPHTPHANHLASLAKARGRDILLHLPMEATDPKWPHGPGSLMLSMSKDELTNTINQDLDTPYRAIGINNHMGSKFSEDPIAMRVLLNTIKSKKLFFIDSLTSINSVGYTLARDLGVKTSKRDIFLDNEQNQTAIMAQIGKLIGLAQRHGSAIGIGHPYPATLEALQAAYPRLTQEVTMVPVHELVE